MFRSRLFLRLFSTLLLIVGGFSSAAYLFAVPLIEETAYEIELEASRTILDNVFELVSKIRGGLEEQRASTIESYKGHLRNVVSMAVNFADHIAVRLDRGEISETEARRLLYDGLRSLRYGSDGYIWVTDYNGLLLSHPDGSFQGSDASRIRDDNGDFILPTIIRLARQQGEAFHTYPWSRLNADSPIPKLSYFRDLPRWGIVIGSGAYLADIDAEVNRRKAEAIDDLRQALRNIRIARTGYVYIFDSANNMIIHPNANIEGMEFGQLPNPASGRPINEELRQVADRGTYHIYRWDKPSDPGNYAYDKISWVRHFEGFDWYIASSVYVEELKRSSVVLGNRILMIALAIMLLGGLLAYVGTRWLVQPLHRLAETATQVQNGDLSAESGIVRDDDIGVLAAAFDNMVRRLRDNIATLDTRVRERTAAYAEIEAQQRLILDAIPALIAYLDQDGIIRFANRGWCEAAGKDKEQVIGTPLRSVLDVEIYRTIWPHVQASCQCGPATFEHKVPGPDGRTEIIRTTVIPHLNSFGSCFGLFMLSLNVTDERETERRLMEAQRLNAVGQLAGGLAHDFNNLLSIILGNLAAAREKFAHVEGLNQYLEPAQRASQRGAGVTGRLLAFARRQPLKPEPVEVCHLVQDMGVLLRQSLPPSVLLQVPQDDPPCWAIADPNQLENALVNLVLNARDAMPDGGHLTIRVGSRGVYEPLTYDETVNPDDYLEIQVQDQGHGFTPDQLARAFEPFYTTKKLGSGLGLSMVYGFVKQSRGYIHIDSEPGQGSRISILLPRAEPAPLPVHDPDHSPAPDVWQGQLAVVAEDNADVRRLLRDQLVSVGFSVLEAENGAEAAELVGQLPEISLVVSDIVMPGVSGLQLARQLRDTHPHVKVILISGFAVEDDADSPDVPILRKPWDKGDLVAAIQRLTPDVERT